ncbi:MAG: M1 family metallopeptidase [Bacteroidetes bacterium]|nr:M1 family metallopeptidase [Bacteroidota bacterium]
MPSFKKLYILFFLLVCVAAHAQTVYFQQEVNYDIHVSLNDKKHELSAFESIQYINNSSASLDVLYFHLWPNAYKDNTTALAKQLLENGETKMYFAKPEDFGYIDSLNFEVNYEPVKWEFDAENKDICKLFLRTPLKSHDTIIITTPFHVKLPSATISRLGHINQAYAITQWYPKPAVYDRDGWHPMPYLNQGEFFSEFGSYNVFVTLPSNYVLAATGDRIDAPEEEQWLMQNVAETEKAIANQTLTKNHNAFPPSSETYKTIHFRQYRVHDFAWFADKRFHALKGEIELPKTGRKVDTWAFFTDNEASLWEKSIEYINDATMFYSYMLGDYPYNHVTAVDGTISAGGGMEYPNITIIGESGNDLTLETTIMHEVGHNWFYGILGSNERDFPMMDEGLNSFYEMRYIRTKYPEKKLTSLFGRDSTFKFFGLNAFKQKAEYEFSYLIAARMNLDQSLALPAAEYTTYNYGAIVYSKTALVMDYLMNYLGGDKFDEGMRFYFENWKFKHPTPKDLLTTLEYHLSTDLTWFAAEMLTSKDKLDYKIINHKQLENHSHLITVKNTGNVVGPVSVAGLKDGRLVGEVWYNGFTGKKVFEFPTAEVDEFRIDYHEFMPEINRKNNNLRTKGLFKRTEPLQLNFFGKLENPQKTQINYLPIGGYNMYNKFMLGVAFYNLNILQKKIEYTIAPMYAFGNKDITGFADLHLNLTPDGIFQQITIGAKAKRFAYDYNSFKDYNASNPAGYHANALYTNYNKIAPFIEFEFRKRDARSPLTQKISYTYNQIIFDQIHYNTASLNNISFYKPSSSTNYLYVNTLQYKLQNNRVINPFSLTYSLDHNWEMVKTSITANYSISFKNKNSLDFRFFAGAFLYTAKNMLNDYRFRMSGWNGYQDYTYDYNYIGRHEDHGVPFAQFVENDGAFKVWTPLGQTSKWMVSLNMKSPKAGKLPLKLFADVGASEFNESLNTQRVLYDAGIELCLWKNIFEIYVPLVYSKDIKTALDANNKGFVDTIRFTLNLHNLNPKNFILNNLF